MSENLNKYYCEHYRSHAKFTLIEKNLTEVKKRLKMLLPRAKFKDFRITKYDI